MIGRVPASPRRGERAITVALACLYAVGLAAHLIAPARPLMTPLTPYVLLAGGLAVLAAAARSAESPGRFLLWCFLTSGGTFAAEAVGVRTGAIFGAYSYGDVLGARLLAVPPVIGFNWTLTLLGALLLARLRPPRRPGLAEAKAVAAAVQVLGTGLLAVLFDLALEPTAVSLRYWSWSDGGVPLRNYAAWFLLSVLAALLYRALRVDVRTRLPVVYLALQWLFSVGIDAAGALRNL